MHNCKNCISCHACFNIAREIFADCANAPVAAMAGAVSSKNTFFSFCSASKNAFVSLSFFLSMLFNTLSTIALLAFLNSLSTKKLLSFFCNSLSISSIILSIIENSFPSVTITFVFPSSFVMPNCFNFFSISRASKNSFSCFKKFLMSSFSERTAPFFKIASFMF